LPVLLDPSRAGLAEVDCPDLAAAYQIGERGPIDESVPSRQGLTGLLVLGCKA
jgi:hypothetical protein